VNTDMDMEQITNDKILPVCAHSFGEIKTALIAIKSQTDKINKCLSGNGRVGMRIEIDRLIQSHKDEERLRIRTSKRIWSVVGTLSVGIVLLFIKILIGA